MDYRNLTAGDDTVQGKIAHIYAATADFIVFKNEAGHGKILTTRKDDVYKAAHVTATRLNAEGGRKFQGVEQDNLTAISGVCMARALQRGVTIDQVEDLFEPLKSFIDDTPKIKVLLGGGETHRHRVYITSKGGLAYICTQHNDDHLANQLSKLDRLSRLVKSQMMRWFRGDVIAVLGGAMLHVFGTSDQSDRQLAVEEATEHVTRKVQEYHHASYLLTLVSVALLISVGATYLLKSGAALEWRYAIIGGAFGAVLSSLQRMQTTDFALTQSRTNVVVQSISRALIGLAAGLLVVVASKSGLAFSIAESNVYALTLVAFSVGFSERVVPDIVSKVVAAAE